MRLFIAADPGPALVPEINRITSALREEAGRLAVQGNWVPEANLHVTLKFLGETSPGLQRAVEDELHGVASGSRPVELGLSNLGAFPKPSKAHVLWCGILDPGERLKRIAETIDERLAGLGIPRESRKFVPHLTLARFKVATDLRALLSSPASQAGQAPGTARLSGLTTLLSGIELMESQTLKSGAVYRVVRRFVFLSAQESQAP